MLKTKTLKADTNFTHRGSNSEFVIDLLMLAAHLGAYIRKQRWLNDIVKDNLLEAVSRSIVTESLEDTQKAIECNVKEIFSNLER